MGEFGKFVSAASIFTQALQVMWYFRLSVMGKQINIIMKSLLGGATKEMLVIVLIIFVSFTLAFLVLVEIDKEADQGLLWIVMNSYRGLLFGDGEAFNNFGMNLMQPEENTNKKMLATLWIVGSVVFNIIILNIIIGVYGNEYNKVEGYGQSWFVRGRAGFCTNAVLSYAWVPWMGRTVNRSMFALAGLSFALTIFVTYVFHSGLFAALLLGGAQNLLLAACMQCDWFHTEGALADRESQYLWICQSKESSTESSDHAFVDRSFLEEQLSKVHDHIDFNTRPANATSGKFTRNSLLS